MTAKRRVFKRWEYLAILKRQRCRCAITGERLNKGEYQFDHKIPLHLGGEDTTANLRAVATRPHQRKSAAEAKVRGKMRRIADQDGLRKKKISKHDRMLKKRQQWRDMP